MLGTWGNWRGLAADIAYAFHFSLTELRAEKLSDIREWHDLAVQILKQRTMRM
ncbi:MAG: GpE family phage tail protein [Methylobacteriaceae bacterium]|nr:GpE family phage tail protein [Methylobacteriaceae bacterium]